MRMFDRLHAIGLVIAGRVRAALLRIRGARIGAKTRLGAMVRARRPWCIALG